jgi:uncharacterized protein involved in exopolysaccharide biosynthesis
VPEPSRSSGGLREVGGSPLPSPDGRLEDELDVGWYIHALQRRWKLVVAVALLGAIAGLAVSTIRPTLYEGVTTLVVVPPRRTSAVQINSATFRAILENASLASQVIGELARYEESRTQALGNSPQLQLVDDAIPPDRPLSRRRVQSAVLGLATGLLVALLAALAWATREGRTVRGDARA